MTDVFNWLATNWGDLLIALGGLHVFLSWLVRVTPWTWDETALAKVVAWCSFLEPLGPTLFKRPFSRPKVTP